MLENMKKTDFKVVLAVRFIVPVRTGRLLMDAGIFKR